MPKLPFPRLRPGQDQLIRDVEGVAARGGVLLCSAPTGIGKTVAALWPMLEAGMRDARRVFFVTAKTSQQALALDTLERMLEPGARPGAVQIATRERFCPLDGHRCGESRCRLRMATNRGAAEALEEDPTLAPRGVAHAETLQALAHARGLCPFELSLLLAERAHAVVGDLGYVFDPRARLRRLLGGESDPGLLIVDEAHNLPDRVAGYDSPSLDRAQLRSLAERCLALAEPPFDRAHALLAEVERRAAERTAALAREALGPPPYVDRLSAELVVGLDAELDALEGAYRGLLAERPGAESLLGGIRPRPRPGSRGRDPLLLELATLRELMRVCRAPTDSYAGIFEPDGLRALSLEPGDRIREQVQGFHASVLMSATLTPFELHQRRLGLEGPDVLTVSLPSPFPRAHRRLVCVPSVDTRLPHRDDAAPRIAELIFRTVRLRAGSYLAFFSSYAYRDQVVACWSRRERAELGVLLQLPGLPAELLVSRLRSRGDATHVLCAVHGGVLAEGVDFPGELAIGVFVVGPGLPAVSLEREILRAHYDAHLCAPDPGGGDPLDERPPESPGFELAYVHPGIQRVVQAGGRVIRTPEDRAFILLIGQRFARAQYRGKLPADWQSDLEDAPDPVPLIERFWAAGGES